MATPTPGSGQLFNFDGAGNAMMAMTLAGSLPVASLAAIAALGPSQRTDGQKVLQLDTYQTWTWEATSVAAADAWTTLAADAPASGRWIFTEGPYRTYNVATVAALRAIGALARAEGMKVMIVADGSLYRFAATSVLTDDIASPGAGFVVAPTAGTGAWIRETTVCDLQIAVTSATADATVLYTVPVGFRFRVTVPFWSVSVTFTTGTAGAAGLSSANAGLSTKGDLLGGATGDLVATLVSTGAYAKGTVGAKIGKPPAILSAGDTIRFDLIAGTYTAGTGIAHVPVEMILAPAA
jgi:hypothetical protein